MCMLQGAAPGAQQEGYVTGECPSSGPAGARHHMMTTLEPPPVCFEARLPPLNPKLSAQLTLLAAGHGSLFAGEFPLSLSLSLSLSLPPSLSVRVLVRVRVRVRVRVHVRVRVRVRVRVHVRVRVRATI